MDLLLPVWAAEADGCTKQRIELALNHLVHQVASDAAQHPDGQRWITPFQQCKPSEPAFASLVIEPATVPPSGGPAVHILVRNLTQRTLAFLMAPPEELFSVTVLSPSGTPAKIRGDKEWLFRPRDSARPAGPVTGSLPVFLPRVARVPRRCLTTGRTPAQIRIQYNQGPA